jgi:hypothetical protein
MPVNGIHAAAIHATTRPPSTIDSEAGPVRVPFHDHPTESTRRIFAPVALPPHKIATSRGWKLGEPIIPSIDSLAADATDDR